MFSSLVLRHKRRLAYKAAHAVLTTPVGNIMSPYVVTIKPTAGIVQAATRMIAQSISCLVVVEPGDSRKPIGVLSERDFIKKVPASTSALKKKVADIMTAPVCSVTADTSLLDVHLLMKANKYRRLIVLHGGYLAGIITQTDLVKYVGEQLPFYAASQQDITLVMSKKIISLPSKATFAQAKKTMLAHNIGAILLKDRSYKGILTEYDVTAQFYDQGGVLNIRAPIAIMNSHIRCVSVTASISYTNKVMLEKNVRRLLVLDGEKIIGIVTQTDICAALFLFAQELADKNFLLEQKEFFPVPQKVIKSNYSSDNLKVYC